MPRPVISNTALIPPRTAGHNRQMSRRKRRRLSRERHSQFAMNRPPSGSNLQEVKDVSPPLVKETWQDDAYSFTESIGELGYLLNLKANAIGECRLRPEVRKPGTDEWEETDDPRVLRVLNAFKPPQGEQGELLRQGALHYEIAGESWLYGAPVKDEHDRPLGLMWEFLSTLECRVEADGKVIRNAWGGSRGRVEMEVDAFVARLHHRDPRYSERADCPVRRLLPICRELVLLTQCIDAVVKSRLPANLFFLPWEVSPAAASGPRDEWEDPALPMTGGDTVEEELEFHLNAPILDRSAAASLNPMLLRGPAFIGDKPTKDTIGLIDLSRPLDGLYREFREETLGRLADGLDTPTEMMKGKSQLSGLGGGNVAQSIDADFIQKHVTPLGRTMTAFITTNYLRPMLTTFEKMDPAEADWFRFSLDTSPITADIDRSANATTGVSLDILSDVAWARHNGFDDDDLADLALRKRRTLERLLYAQPTLGPAILPILYPNDDEITKALEKWEVGQSEPGGAQQSPSLGRPGIPPLSTGPQRVLLTALDDAMVYALLGAAHQVVDRALEKAGNRLISRLNGIDKGAAERLRHEKRTNVLTVAGAEQAAVAGLGPSELFSECFDQFAGEVTEWLKNALVARGDDPYRSNDAAATAAMELARQLTLLCASALQQPLRAGENGFKVPTEMVLSALSAGDLVNSGSS